MQKNNPATTDKKMPSMKRLVYSKTFRPISAVKHENDTQDASASQRSNELHSINASREILHRRSSMANFMPPQLIEEETKIIAPAKELDPIWDEMVN